mgnify:CR=1 FL=1
MQAGPSMHSMRGMPGAGGMIQGHAMQPPMQQQPMMSSHQEVPNSAVLQAVNGMWQDFQAVRMQVESMRREMSQLRGDVLRLTGQLTDHDGCVVCACACRGSSRSFLQLASTDVIHACLPAACLPICLLMCSFSHCVTVCGHSYVRTQVSLQGLEGRFDARGAPNAQPGNTLVQPSQLASSTGVSGVPGMQASPSQPGGAWRAAVPQASPQQPTQMMAMRQQQQAPMALQNVAPMQLQSVPSTASLPAPSSTTLRPLNLGGRGAQLSSADGGGHADAPGVGMLGASAGLSRPHTTDGLGPSVSQRGSVLHTSRSAATSVLSIRDLRDPTNRSSREDVLRAVFEKVDTANMCVMCMAGVCVCACGACCGLSGSGVGEGGRGVLTFVLSRVDAVVKPLAVARFPSATCVTMLQRQHNRQAPCL